MTQAKYRTIWIQQYENGFRTSDRSFEGGTEHSLVPTAHLDAMQAELERLQSQLAAVTEERDRLKVLTNDSNPVPDLRTSEWLDPECHQGCQSLKWKKAIKEREDSYWKAYDTIHERNRTIESLQQQLAAANERAEVAAKISQS